MPTETFVKGKCQHCDGPIEFDASNAGQTAECPHCGMETFLFRALSTDRATVTLEPSKAKRRKFRWRFLVLALTTAVLLAGLVYVTNKAIESGFAAALGGGLLGVAVLVLVTIWAVLWLVFPVFVYFSMERMKRQLSDSNIIATQALACLREIQSNTSRIPSEGLVDK